MAVFQTHATPNPNSLKVTSDAGTFIEEGMLSFSSRQEADGHPLAKRLFAVEGVANVFIMPAFLTVTKQPAATWDLMLPGLADGVRQFFAGQASPKSTE